MLTEIDPSLMKPAANAGSDCASLLLDRTIVVSIMVLMPIPTRRRRSKSLKNGRKKNLSSIGPKQETIMTVNMSESQWFIPRVTVRL